MAGFYNLLTRHFAKLGGITFLDGVHIFSHAGIPTNGASGTMAGKAAKGSLCIDSLNAALYQNTGTKASPTWSER